MSRECMDRSCEIIEQVCKTFAASVGGLMADCKAEIDAARAGMDTDAAETAFHRGRLLMRAQGHLEKAAAELAKARAANGQPAGGDA